ncbi:hypothetical protein ACERZ8_17765 [Tateyamaria armeniaca]|uniref:Transposase DDE domain-containing protein n=1 Tax=Tateyamaria armeniaca TaxID=2518930 RepID=A0ABW8UWU1_9RHOB
MARRLRLDSGLGGLMFERQLRSDSRHWRILFETQLRIEICAIASRAIDSPWGGDPTEPLLRFMAAMRIFPISRL